MAEATRDLGVDKQRERHCVLCAHPVCHCARIVIHSVLHSLPIQSQCLHIKYCTQRFHHYTSELVWIVIFPLGLYYPIPKVYCIKFTLCLQLEQDCVKHPSKSNNSLLRVCLKSGSGAIDPQASWRLIATAPHVITRTWRPSSFFYCSVYRHFEKLHQKNPLQCETHACNSTHHRRNGTRWSLAPSRHGRSALAGGQWSHSATVES